MFVITQDRRHINLANITEFYAERKTVEGGKQKYVLYFDKIPAGTFSKHEMVNKVMEMLDAAIQAKQRMEIVAGESPKIVYYQNYIFQIPDEDELA